MTGKSAPSPAEPSRRRSIGQLRWRMPTAQSAQRLEPDSRSRSASEKFRPPLLRGLSTSGAENDGEDFPTMRFMPHTDADVRAMLDTIGIDHIDDLIAHVPANLRNTA